MRFLEGAGLSEAIRSVVARAPVDMAVAFWGNEAVALLGLPDDLTRYRIACDAYSGACSPTALGTLLARGALLVDVPGLHAKVYRASEAMVVTSANASTNGLNEDANPVSGLEAGIWTDDAMAIAKAGTWIDTIIGTAVDQGHVLAPRHLAEIERLWLSRRRSRPLRMTLADAILRNATALADRVERAYIYRTEKPPKGVEERYRASESYDEKTWSTGVWPFFWGEFPGANPGDVLLCFETARTNFTWVGAWLIHEPLPGKGERIWPARELDDLQGMPFGDMAKVASRITAAVRAGRLQRDAPPMPLSDLAAALLPSFADDHLAKIRTDPMREAYRFLVAHAPSLGLVPTPNSGFVPAIKLLEADQRYPFSFIVNVGDLLFYLRDPALNASPGLATRAEEAGFTVEIPKSRTPRDAPKTERQIRISTPDDARRLVAWLRTELPLPPAKSRGRSGYMVSAARG